jgi:hypothetical protein
MHAEMRYCASGQISTCASGLDTLFYRDAVHKRSPPASATVTSTGPPSLDDESLGKKRDRFASIAGTGLPSGVVYSLPNRRLAVPPAQTTGYRVPRGDCVTPVKPAARTQPTENAAPPSAQYQHTVSGQTRVHTLQNLLQLFMADNPEHEKSCPG